MTIAFQDGSRVLVRFTTLDRVVARIEKVVNELAIIMQYLAWIQSDWFLRRLSETSA